MHRTAAAAAAFLRRAANGLLDGVHRQNAFSTVRPNRNRYRAAAEGSGLADATHCRPPVSSVARDKNVFGAARETSTVCRAPWPTCLARPYFCRPSAAVNDGHFGTVVADGTTRRNADVPAESHRLFATRCSSDVAPPEPPRTTGPGRVFGAVRRATAFECDSKPGAVARRVLPPRPSVAINGFGRIGKCLLRLAIKTNNVNVVAVNEPYVDVKSMARSFGDDPVHGKFRGHVEVKDDNHLCVNDKLIKVYHEEDPEKIKWREMKVDYVIDSSGKFTDIAVATKHISPGGAKKVVIVAPSVDAPTFIKGVNYRDYKKTVSVASTGSSTASCAAPLLHAIDEKFHVVGYMVSSAPIMMPDRFFMDATDYAARNRNVVREPDSGRSAVYTAIPELHGTSEGLCFLKLYMRLKMNAYPNDIKCLVWKMATCSDDSAVSYRQDLGKFVFGGKHPISRYSAVVDFNYVHVNGKHVTAAVWYDNATGRAARALDLVEHMTRVDHYCQE